MTRAVPESIAAAAIITWLPPEQSVSQRRQRVLNDELRLPVTEPFGKPSETVSPLGITVRGLVAQRKEGCLNLNARSRVRLTDIQLEALMTTQGTQRHILRDVRPVEPVHVDLLVGT